MSRHPTLPTARPAGFAATLKPRNPMVAAALMRQAGAHRRSTSALRQQQRHDVQRELREQHPPSP